MAWNSITGRPEGVKGTAPSPPRGDFSPAQGPERLLGGKLFLFFFAVLVKTRDLA